MSCQYLDANGHACGANALTGRTFCFFHDPDPAIAEARRQAQSQGGSKPKPKQTLPPIDIDFANPLRIAPTLTKVANLVYAGALDRRRAETIARLAGSALRAIEAGAMAQELARLKRMLEAEKAAPPDFSKYGGTEFEDSNWQLKRLAEKVQRIQRERSEKAAADGHAQTDNDERDSEGQ